MLAAVDWYFFRGCSRVIDSSHKGVGGVGYLRFVLQNTNVLLAISTNNNIEQVGMPSLVALTVRGGMGGWNRMRAMSSPVAAFGMCGAEPSACTSLVLAILIMGICESST